MSAGSLMAFMLLVVQLSLSAYIEGVAASVDTRKEKKHEKFVPLVAFECGFRNRFMGGDGVWVSDPNTFATCLSGKLDILKYCRKAYPKLDITNIVEYSHEVEIPGWCREEGSPCKWTHTVRPYHCIIGEFHSEALQVPLGCRFGHINDRQLCNDYAHWKDAAYKQCRTKVVNDKRMVVRSFAVLEPCGLDLFTGVEFVCCPDDQKTEDFEKKELDANEVDDDDYDDDDDDSDEYSEDSNDDEAKEVLVRGGSQDPYFKMSDSANEHERFKEAQQRLEKKHRAKINKVMREWSDLETRYKKMKKTDDKGAEAFKQKMTSRFQKTVASLEEENKEQKKQLEDVHEERVQAHLNEKKRQATHDYRAALAVQVGAANKHNVLRTLKTYIRAEEKDRTHMINRFRHLLHTDRDEAEIYEPILLHQLRYIDLRINGTLAMLRDFPELERQVRPVALEFWADYRRENTPEVTADEYTAIGSEQQNVKLVRYYKDSYDRLHNAPWTRKTTLSATTVTEPPKTLADLDENRGNAEDAVNGASIEIKKQPTEFTKKVAIEKIVHGKLSTKFDRKTKQLATNNDDDDSDDDDGDDDDGDDDDDEDDDDDDDGDDDDDEGGNEEDDDNVGDDIDDGRDDDDDGQHLSNVDSVERELHVEIEPIVSEAVRVHDVPPGPSYAKHEPFKQTKIDIEDVSTSAFTTSAHLLLIFASVATIIFTLFAIIMAHQRSRRRGFIEVDICTPEERHVNGMQVNGYENPTYSFFDNKP